MKGRNVEVLLELKASNFVHEGSGYPSGIRHGQDVQEAVSCGNPTGQTRTSSLLCWRFSDAPFRMSSKIALTTLKRTQSGSVQALDYQ
ncbi:MAG: hypothetical protein EOP84_30125 [Verrucomicrobiaceae bacterium]|nr:MAG: hypothetical protein EOP84_30125 [Verrucomicrobiaceae bacterium]